MFQFPGLASACGMTGVAAGRVSPFGHPGITAYVQLPQAYRSLSRPSSPLDAKASTVCLIAFDLKFVRTVATLAAHPYGISASHSVLIPHTRSRSIAGATDSIIHPSIVKEQVGRPQAADQTESDAS